jgi:hypothetical protein
MIADLGENSFDNNKVWEVKGSYNFNKRFQAGLILSYYPDMPYKFIPPTEFRYKDHSVIMGWDPNAIPNYPDWLLISLTNVINPKLYGSVKTNLWKFYFSLAVTAGYVHAVGLPSKGLLPLVEITVSQDADKAEFIKEYRKAMRPTGGYSYGIQPGFTFYLYKNIGINAALNIEHFRIRDPKFALNRGWSEVGNETVTFGINYRLGAKKKSPATKK